MNEYSDPSSGVSILLNEKRKSSAVSGTPSDHFASFLKLKIHSIGFLGSVGPQDSATPGRAIPSFEGCSMTRPSNRPLIILFSILLAIGGLEFSKRRIRELDLEGSNIQAQSIRAAQTDTDRWNESKSKWGKKTSNYDERTARPIYQSDTDSPASTMFQDIDWRQALGGSLFLLFIFADIIF